MLLRFLPRFRPRALRRYLILPALAASLIFGHCSNAAPTTSGVSLEDFTEIVEISRLPPAQQAPKIVRLYQWLPELRAANEVHSGRLEYANYPKLTPEEKQLSANEQFPLAYQRGGWERYLTTDSHDLALQVLRAHPDELAALIHDDLRAPDEARQKRGLQSIWALPSDFGDRNRQAGDAPKPLNARWFETIYADVARVFQNAPPSPPASSDVDLYSVNTATPLKARAEAMLALLADSRAIALFIADDAAQPALHYWAIAKLTGSEPNRWEIGKITNLAPNDAVLQPLEKLLVSDDAKSRYGALFALPTANAATRTALPDLIQDSDAQTRALAVSRTFGLEAPEFKKVDAQLKNRLTDMNPKVRLNAAFGFAKRGEAFAAPVLLQLWREEEEREIYLRARFALAKLTGEYLFGPIAKNANGKRGFDDKYADAIARVEAWIAAHPAQ